MSENEREQKKEDRLEEAFRQAEEANLFETFALFKNADSKWAVCDLLMLGDWDFYIYGCDAAEAILRAVQYLRAYTKGSGEAFRLLDGWRKEIYGRH